MPSAADYRDAAGHLRRIAADVAGTHRELRPGSPPQDYIGGPLRTVLDDDIAAVRSHCERAVTELERLASLCDRRADEVCDPDGDTRWEMLVGAALTAALGPLPIPMWPGRC